MAPTGRHRHREEAVEQEVDRILKKPDVIKRFRNLGAEPVGSARRNRSGPSSIRKPGDEAAGRRIRGEDRLIPSRVRRTPGPQGLIGSPPRFPASSTPPSTPLLPATARSRSAARSSAPSRSRCGLVRPRATLPVRAAADGDERQRQAVLLREPHRDTHVLGHQVELEGVVEGPAEHPLREVIAGQPGAPVESFSTSFIATGSSPARLPMPVPRWSR